MKFLSYYNYYDANYKATPSDFTANNTNSLSYFN